MPRKPAPLDLTMMLQHWLRDLRGQRRSAQTQRSYRIAVESFLEFTDELTKDNVAGWIDTQRDASAATVRLRLTALKLFAKWLAVEEGFDAAPILAVPLPKMSQAVVADLDDGEVARMVKVCGGAKLRDKRDKAILLLTVETGLRAAELLALDIGDVDLDTCRLLVRHGKGDKARRVGFTPATAAAVGRYVRARQRAIRRPAEGPLWISERGNRLAYTGLVSTLKARAADAGVIGFHVHRLRHSAAVRWLRNGGSEVGLRAHCGWTDLSMVAKYTQAASEQLAAAEFDRLGLGLQEL
ncbi:MAG: tyrosine-type recombinase/integrase [Mycobacterium sp.]